MKRRYSWPLRALLILVLLVLTAQLALPWLIRDYLNDKLAEMGDYRGHIADIDLAWWRGAYRINELTIVKVTGDVPVPLLDAPLTDLSVSWPALWREHAVVAEVYFERPQLNFVDGGENDQATQTGAGTDWRDQLNKLLPITLNELRVIDGRISFHNFTTDPKVELSADQVNASLYNLTNVGDEPGDRVAHFEGRALLLEHAPLEAEATFDPFEQFEDFELRLRAKDIDLTRFNDFAGPTAASTSSVATATWSSKRKPITPSSTATSSPCCEMSRCSTGSRTSKMKIKVCCAPSGRPSSAAARHC